MNSLTGKVQIFPPIGDYDHTPNTVIWDAPAGFPDIETHADLVDGDGDLLLVSNGWRLKVISVQQVTRPPQSGRSAETTELQDTERKEYDEAR